MKKCLTILLALASLLALTAPAYADMLWEPPDNDFYAKHYEECESVVRTFYANGPEGFVTLWDAPGGSSVQAQYENGTALMVYWRYQDWGCITTWDSRGDSIDGWVPMDQLRLIYDYLSFQEEYADQIRPYHDEFGNYAGDAKVVNFYEYPGAPEPKYTWDLGDTTWNVLNELTGTGGYSSCISSIFVDEEGLTWGFVSYLYGHLDGWFCLDRPDGTDFPLRDIPQPELTAPQTPVLPASSYLPYLLVAGVVLATGGLLFWFYGRRRGRAEG